MSGVIAAWSSVFGQVVTPITVAPAFAEAHSGKEGAGLQTEFCERPWRVQLAQPIGKDEPLRS